MEVKVESERMENDLYIYEKKVPGGIKITEHVLIFSRKKLKDEEVRVESIPLKLPNSIIYFHCECKY